MAKDGTFRGGRRVRSGDKPMDLADKIVYGKSAKAMSIPDFTDQFAELDATDLSDVAVELEGYDMPTPSEYLSAVQRDGKTLGADEIYKETWLWLKERNCEKLINPRLLESYSEAFARFIQCEKAISSLGLVGKHPTTGGAMASPFVTMSMQYQKQANLLWYEIFDVVKQNCTTAVTQTPRDDMMEQLLQSRK